MKKRLIPTGLRSMIGLGLGLLISGEALAVNWLMAQGTQHPKAPEHKIWGFIQPTYTKNYGAPLSKLAFAPLVANNGKFIAQNVVPPKLEQTDAIHLRRARIGMRGKLSDKINYFTLFEVADNGLSYDPFGERERFIAPDHLSLTFNHIPKLRVRAGLFKNPGSEESYQAIHTFDYIDFTDFTAREILERFANGARAPAASAQGNIGTPQPTGYGFSAVRDWGVQFFDRVKTGKWDLGYALKIGRGEGIHSSDENFNPELYLYGSAEYDLPGGKGVRKNGVKVFAWHQQGKRDFDSDPTETEYDRERQGIGFKALGKFFGAKYKQRFSGEYMLADGMIFVAPAGNVKGGGLQYAVNEGNKARGWYLDYGFYLNKNWQFDFRYDKNDLLYKTAADIDPGNEREITGKTLGVTYHFTPKLRLTANYVWRKAEAPVAYANPALTADIRHIVSTLDNRLNVQFTWVF